MEELIKPKLEIDFKFLVETIVRFVKRDIFERFIKTGTLSEEDEEFCDKIDWYPIDELEVREEFVKRVLKAEKGPHFEMTIEELDKLMGLK